MRYMFEAMTIVQVHKEYSQILCLFLMKSLVTSRRLVAGHHICIKVQYLK